MNSIKTMIAAVPVICSGGTLNVTTKASPITTPGTMPTLTESAMLIDDGDAPGKSTIMSKIDISSGLAGVRINVNPEVKLRAVIEVAENLRKALSVDSVLPKLLDSLFKIFVQADRGFVVLRGANPGQLVIKAVKQRRADSEDMIRISRTIINTVLEAKQAILSADAAADARFEMSQSIADFRIRSMMCAPLVNSDGESLGVIQVDTIDQRSRFQQEDLDVLASVANQAAFAGIGLRLGHHQFTAFKVDVTPSEVQDLI